MTDDELKKIYQSRYPRAEILVRHARGAFGMTQIIEIKDPPYVKVGQGPHCPTCRCGTTLIGGREDQ